MIKPDTVNLLVFDLDGTLSVTIRPVYESIKRIYTGLGISCTLKVTEIEKLLGNPSFEFYNAITPSGSSVSWQDMRDRIQDEQKDAFRKYGETYPQVSETLDILKQRGYKLALYSNSNPGYFNTVISALGISDHFDYRECVGENDLTKSQLIRKIMQKFGNPVTAVIGDRLHDIEAARENDALSIGCLYGYGEAEPEQADITINSFEELSSVFDRKTPIFERILLEAEKKKQADIPLIIGITGIDASGKTLFADGFENYLKENRYQVQTIHIDDFHNPTAIRYDGEDQAANYFDKSFNVAMITDGLLAPARRGISSVELTSLDLETDQYERTLHYNFSPNTCVIVEGVFLFREELSPYIDYCVHLDISYDECLKRGLDRGGNRERYETKYIPAQQAYLLKYPPRVHADIIIDNMNYQFPKIRTTNETD